MTVTTAAGSAFHPVHTALRLLRMAEVSDSRSDLQRARDQLASAVAIADAALGAPDTADRLALLLAGPLFPPHSPTPRA